MSKRVPLAAPTSYTLVSDFLTSIRQKLSGRFAHRWQADKCIALMKSNNLHRSELKYYQ